MWYRKYIDLIIPQWTLNHFSKVIVTKHTGVQVTLGNFLQYPKILNILVDLRRYANDG